MLGVEGQLFQQHGRALDLGQALDPKHVAVGERMAGLVDHVRLGAREQPTLPRVHTAALERHERAREREQIHLRRHLTHERAAAATAHQHTALNQRLGRLAHGRPAHAVTFGQLVFRRDLLARAEAASLDLREQAFGQLVVERHR
jgi:hypothetical protein